MKQQLKQQKKIQSGCQNEKHKPRDNKFGVTWCVNCGRLFTKPCGKDLQESEKIIIRL